MIVQVKFKAQGANSLIGGFDHGDKRSVSKEIADHFVEIGVADYVEQVKQDQPEVKRGRKPKEK